MSRWRIIVALCVAIPALSGCVAEEAKAVTSTPTAAEPTVASDTGSIAGKTLNEEQLPIEGVGVVIAETRNSTKSDAVGAFTFNGMPPGTYTILTGRAGFKEAAKKVEVRAGEITEVRIILKEVALPEAWVSVDRQSRAMLAGSYVAAYPNDVQTWNQKWSTKDDPLALEDLLLEADWNPTTLLADGIRFWSGIGTWNSGQTLCSGTGKDPYVCPVPPEKIQQDWGCDFADDKTCIAEWMFRPGGSSVSQGLVGVWPQDTVTVYVSHFYRMPMPAEYKARP